MCLLPSPTAGSGGRELVQHYLHQSPEGRAPCLALRANSIAMPRTSTRRTRRASLKTGVRAGAKNERGWPFMEVKLASIAAAKSGAIRKWLSVRI